MNVISMYFFFYQFLHSLFVIILLGSLPNSHRQIEPELMRRLIAELHVNDIISSGSKVKGLELFNKQSSVGSLSDTNEFLTEEMHRFLMYSRNANHGSENFPGSLLPLQFENIFLEKSIYDLLVEYYTDTYVDSTFRKPFHRDTSNSVVVVNKAN